MDEEKVDLPSMNKNQNGLSSEVGGEPIKLSPVEMVDDGIGGETIDIIWLTWKHNKTIT